MFYTLVIVLKAEGKIRLPLADFQSRFLVLQSIIIRILRDKLFKGPMSLICNSQHLGHFIYVMKT